ncbi:cupin domain-containing protein [Microbacterium sp.]|uniref:AraC family transcriptional regulator n=1 Tax=Microbacterium sp. TaxID=51671 RepID=UPI0039E39860
MDVLSDVLLAVRLSGAVFFDIDAGSPFVTESPPPEAIAGRVRADSEHLIAFHVVLEGACWAFPAEEQGPTVRVSGGEIVIYPAGDANVLSSAPGMRARANPALYYHPPDRALPFPVALNRESGAERCRLVCGFFGCDTRPFNPLLDSLPRIVHVPVSEQSWRWMSELLDTAVKARDTPNAGQEAMLTKLSELMFLEALRAHIASLPSDSRTWVSGLRDPQVGAALRLIHGRYGDPWTLERLAHETAMSRSSFAERFTEFVGMSPMAYLARWRIQVAARLLRTTSMSVAQVAEQIGYQSDSALSRAFKRSVGQTPSAWRQHAR